MMFPTHIPVREIRQVIEHLPDDAMLHVAYGEVQIEHIFVRIDSLTKGLPGPNEATVPLLTISLIDSESEEEDLEERGQRVF